MKEGIQNFHGARPVNQVIDSMWWTRTSRLSITNSFFEKTHLSGALRVESCAASLEDSANCAMFLETHTGFAREKTPS